MARMAIPCSNDRGQNGRPAKCASRLSRTSFPIALRVSTVPLDWCGCTITLSKASSRGRCSARSRNTSRAAPADAFFERVNQGGLVDDRTARDVDEQTVDPSASNTAALTRPRVASPPDTDATRISLAAASSNRRPVVGVVYAGRRPDVGIGDVHARTLGAPRDRPADAPEAENAERLAPEACAELAGRRCAHAPDRTWASPATTLRM